MTRIKLKPQTIVTAILALLLFSSVAWHSALAQGAPRPAEQPPALPAKASAALSTTLSYYFISGTAFTTSSSAFSRSAAGCANQVPLVKILSAPVQLPQASVVVSMTLFTVDLVMTDTISTAIFVANDGQGTVTFPMSVDSQPNFVGYQQNNSDPLFGPATIDNQFKSYYVNWYKTGSFDSPYLALCGVRLAYYAPVGATFLPTIEK